MWIYKKTVTLNITRILFSLSNNPGQKPLAYTFEGGALMEKSLGILMIMSGNFNINLNKYQPHRR